MNKRILVFMALFGILMNSSLYFIYNLNNVIGLIILFWCLIAVYFNNATWADRFRENLGIGVLSGLIVSFFRDVNNKSFDNSLISMYFIVFAFALILLMKGASKGEDL